jgi:hypothetical protein
MNWILVITDRRKSASEYEYMPPLGNMSTFVAEDGCTGPTGVLSGGAANLPPFCRRLPLSTGPLCGDSV